MELEYEDRSRASLVPDLQTRSGGVWLRDHLEIPFQGDSWKILTWKLRILFALLNLLQVGKIIVSGMPNDSLGEDNQTDSKRRKRQADDEFCSEAN